MAHVNEQHILYTIRVYNAYISLLLNLYRCGEEERQSQTVAYHAEIYCNQRGVFKLHQQKNAYIFLQIY